MWADIFSEPPDPGAKEADAAMSVSTGSGLSIPGLEVREEIARGGMGIVYRAQQLNPSRPVALKMMLPHQSGLGSMRQRFQLEIQAIAGLDHPGILPVYQVGEQGGLPWFTMKLAAGGSLAAHRDEFQGKWRAIARLMTELADAVQFAHDRGVLHRDLKPGNILFDELRRPYISDFGLAKVVGANNDLTRPLEFLGTPSYVAPEVATGSALNATTASDIYSLGSVLYELLAGRPPFEAESAPALLKKIAEVEPTPPSGIPGNHPGSASGRCPRDLEVICLKCLAKEPGRRYARARELAEDLHRWLSSRPIHARPASRVERLGSWARRNPALALLSSTLALVLAGAIALEARANRRTRRALGESLVAQARLQRGTGQVGQRHETLALIRLAKATGAAGTRTARAQLRSEVAAALAAPDARLVRRWDVAVLHFENEFDFSADLSRFAATTKGGGCAVSSTADQRVLWKLAGRTNDPPVRLRLSAGGDFLVVHFQNSMTEVHALATSDLRPTWSGGFPATLATFSADGRKLVITHVEPAGGRQVLLVNPEDGTVEAQAPAPDHEVMVCDPDAGRVAFASKSLSVRRLGETTDLWSVKLPAPACAMAWSPEGRRIAVALTGPLIRENEETSAFPVLLFDAETGRRESTFVELPSHAARLAFHPGGESLAVATWHGGLVWGGIRPDGFRLRLEGAQRALRFSVDGTRLAFSPTADELGVLEPAPPSLLLAWQAPRIAERSRQSTALSQDGRWLAISCADGLGLWDVPGKRQIAFLPQSAAGFWSTTVFAEGDSVLYYSSIPTGVRRFDFAELQRAARGQSATFDLGRQVGPASHHLLTSLAADGKGLLVIELRKESTNDRVPARVWLWPDGDPARARNLIWDHAVNGAAMIPGTPWLTTTDLVAPDVTIWNVGTGERVRDLGLHQGVISRPTTDGRWLLTRTRSEYGVWEVGSWRRLNGWPTPHSESQSSLTPVPGAPLVAVSTTDGQLRFRHLPDGEEILQLPAATRNPVANWIFTPDARSVLGIPDSGPPFEWDLIGLRKELARLGLDWQEIE